MRAANAIEKSLEIGNVQETMVNEIAEQFETVNTNKPIRENSCFFPWQVQVNVLYSNLMLKNWSRFKEKSGAKDVSICSFNLSWFSYDTRRRIHMSLSL